MMGIRATASETLTQAYYPSQLSGSGLTLFSFPADVTWSHYINETMLTGEDQPPAGCSRVTVTHRCRRG